MQAALTIAPSVAVAPLKPTTKNVSQVTLSPSGFSTRFNPQRGSAIKAATVTYDPSTVDYSSMNSVFPAEACETVGGEACLADMYPEVKLERNAEARPIASEPVDREYLDYNDSKTVFREEACDDLGGEFCGFEYQTGD